MRELLTIVLLFFFVAYALGTTGRPQEEMAYNKAFYLAIEAQELYGMPVEKKARIIWNYDDDWENLAYTDCKAWTIMLHHGSATKNTLVFLEKVLPHEYGHLVHCYLHNGRVGGNDGHNRQWKFYVTDLGGDPDFGVN